MRAIGKKYVHEQVVFIPAQLYLEKTYTTSYECLTCKSIGADYIKQAPVPKQPFTHSLVSPSILAQVFHQKFELSLPLYRQEKEWASLGFSLSRRTLTNWVIQASQDWLAPIYERLKHYLLQEEILHADETYYNVLASDKQKTYYWLFRTIEQAQHQIVLYQHEETRSGTISQKFLETFKGLLHCDGYAGYHHLDDIELINCWAHVRRKFFEAKGTSQNSLGAQGERYCNQLFRIEQELSGLEPEEKRKAREKKLRPIMEQFFDWLSNSAVLARSKLGKAITYALNQKEGLMNVLKDGRAALSNNLAERSIRPTTIGRKNWNFSVSTAGAQANGVAYSIIETAKANKLNPTKYLAYLFERLPNLPELTDKALEEFLPWTEEVQFSCQ
jgi:transposase